MAEHIKFRLTAAKVGVSAALLALIGGVVERIRSGPSEVRITPASAPGHFLKLGGIQGDVKHALIKLEDKWIKLDTALTNVVAKLHADYLKIDKANSEFLKINKANAEYLKINTANANFLKIRSANSEFLKIRTAQNEFVQGRGGVVSAAVQIPTTMKGSAPLLKSPDGSLIVSISGNSDQLVVQIDNTTGALLPAVLTADGGAPASMDLKPGMNTIMLRPTGQNPAHHLQLQTFGDGSVRSATTLVLSTEPSPSNQNVNLVVAQMLIGLL
jgi:hypothetical protein